MNNQENNLIPNYFSEYFVINHHYYIYYNNYPLKTCDNLTKKGCLKIFIFPLHLALIILGNIFFWVKDDDEVKDKEILSTVLFIWLYCFHFLIFLLIFCVFL